MRLAAIALALIVPTAAPAQDWSKAERVEVSLANFRFAPATIPLVHGRAYLLHLVNRAGGGHNFAAKSFFAAAAVASADRGKIAGGKVELDGGASADIRFVAPAPGTYAIRCTHFLHAGFGMKGAFVVR